MPVQGDSYKRRDTDDIYKVSKIKTHIYRRGQQQFVVLRRYGCDTENFVYVAEDEFHFKSIHEGKLDWDWVEVEKINNESGKWYNESNGW